MRVIAGKYRSHLAFASRNGYTPDIRSVAGNAVQRAHRGKSVGARRKRVAGSVRGNGAIGIEALSRGAKAVHFVESSPSAANMIRG